MANVIPTEVRRAIRSDIRARLVLAGSLVALVGAAATFAAFLPAYMLLATESRSASAGANAVPAGQQAQEGGIIKRTNALSQLLAPVVATKTMPVDVIGGVLAARPKGVRVDRIVYTAGKPSSILVAGTADTDTAVSDYRAALSANPLFASVSVPVGALVGTDGGSFSITIVGTF